MSTGLSFLRMYFIMDECDELGVFVCQSLIVSKLSRDFEVALFGGYL
jgi:hypothetical protein